MKLVIREEAVDDLDEIHDWIAKDNLGVAIRVVRALRQRMNRVLLPELVNIGRPGRKKGTRELVEWPYIIVCKVARDLATRTDKLPWLFVSERGQPMTRQVNCLIRIAVAQNGL